MNRSTCAFGQGDRGGRVSSSSIPIAFAMGTAHGKPIPSPVWASTVWTKKNGKWTAVFHQESASTPAPAK